MRGFVFGTLLVLFLASASVEASSGTPISQALPTGARLVREAAIPGYSGHFAVVYRTDRSHLGVAVGGHLTWDRALPGAPDLLIAPGPAGLFEARVKAAGATPAYFLAYQMSGGSVRSAIEGHVSGMVNADEGFIVRSDTVTARKRDLAHQGEVRYRVVTRFEWNGGQYARLSRVRIPDYTTSSLPTPSVLIQTGEGDRILAVVEVADTEPKRELGLMYRRTLDPDAGMIFVWQQPVLDSFWMKNTFIPLSIAFIGSDGTIQEMQDMAAQSETLHTPAQPYLSALEVNQGFFRQNGIAVGDRVIFHLSGQTPR